MNCERDSDGELLDMDDPMQSNYCAWIAPASFSACADVCTGLAGGACTGFSHSTRTSPKDVNGLGLGTVSGCTIYGKPSIKDADPVLKQRSASFRNVKESMTFDGLSGGSDATLTQTSQYPDDMFCYARALTRPHLITGRL